MTDQTPITRTDLRRLAHAVSPEYMPITGTRLAELIDSVLAYAETSASPPRVPGASAHPVREGVESGPGQPMADICERLMIDATLHNRVSTPWDWHENTAELEREAAAEIRRLRAELIEAQAALPQVARENRRAGIEDAAKMARAHTTAQVHATFGPDATLQDAFAIGYQQCGDAVERAIRALAARTAQKGGDNG